MTHRIFFSCFALPLTLVACGSADTPEAAKALTDAYCLSGNIHTNTDAGLSTALAVKDGIIIYVGNPSEAADGNVPKWCSDALGTAANQALELKSLGTSHLYPGFTDGHAHLLGIGLREMTLNLEGTTSIQNLVERVQSETRTTPKGTTIYGRGWIETHWPENRFPTREDLDAVSPDHPIILERSDGHAVVVNTVALALAGITKDTPSPFGGEILKGTDGQPTGMLIDEASELVLKLTGEMTEAKRRAAYKKGSEVYAAYGWTGLHNMSAPPEDIDLIEDMVKSGDIKIRVYNGLDWTGAERLFDDGTRDEGHVKTRMIKVYSDGALGSRGAALLAPYADDPENVGLLTFKRDDLLPIYKEALRSGVQVATHAIGDRANRLVLDWYQEAFAAVPPEERAVKNPRWRIEHAQILNVQDLERFNAMGVIPSMQPSHAIGDLYFAKDRVGEERLEGGYAWRDLLDSGAIIVGGSDAPVERGDPRIEFYAAVARKDLQGKSEAHWHPEQKVTRPEALNMITRWPAYAAFMEDELGSIAVGKRADFTVLSDDIMTMTEDKIPSVTVEMTIVDGRVIYSK